MWVFRKWKHVSWLSSHNYIWPKPSLEQFLTISASFFSKSKECYEQDPTLASTGRSLCYQQAFVLTVYSEFQPSPLWVIRKVSNLFWTPSGTYCPWFCSWKLLDPHTSMSFIPPHLQGVACVSGTSFHSFAIQLPVISVFCRVYHRNANSSTGHKFLSA